MAEYVNIKITKCSVPSYWYYGHVGEVFRVLKIEKPERLLLDKDSLRTILIDDCELISDEEYLVISKQKEREIEVELEKRKNIAMGLKMKMME